MKTLRFLILGLLLSICVIACHNKPDATDSHGNPIYLSNYQGKWLVVNYWATWCEPCLTELPALNALYANHSDKLVVLGVNFDSLPAAEIQHFADTLHLTLPLLSSFPLTKFDIQEIPTLPATLIITPQGKLHKILYGSQTQETLLKEIGQ
jgi:peroxiredoxin